MLKLAAAAAEEDEELLFGSRQHVNVASKTEISRRKK